MAPREPASHIPIQPVAALLTILAAAMYAFATVQIELNSLKQWKGSMEGNRFTRTDYEKERALVIAELEKLQAESQILCQFVRANSVSLSKTPPSCPITYRAQNPPR